MKPADEEAFAVFGIPVSVTAPPASQVYIGG
jgi:hypothetical protein